MVIGCVVAFLPERAMAYATSKVPERAATTALLLLLALSAPVLARAQTGAIVEESAIERELKGEIMCTCGCRLTAATCGMPNCEGKAGQRAKLKAFIAQGLTKDQILAAFVKDFGSEDILSRPRDHGFNRLAWAFPYATGLLGIGIVAGMAVRWTRRRAEASAALATVGTRPDLEDQLDDELRDLD